MIESILYSILGTVFGMLIGVIPGAGAFIAVSIMLPLLALTTPINIMLFYVAILIADNYTNSIIAIAYGIPGDATAVPTSKVGHRFFKKGFGGVAASSTAISSTIGVLFATLFFLLLLPNIIKLFFFYNSVVQTFILFGSIILITFFTSQSKIISLLLFLLGGILGHIGTNSVTFQTWGTFGNNYLSLGIPFSAIMIGMYIIPEFLKIKNLDIAEPKFIDKFTVKDGITKPSIVGSFIGFWAGLVPGVTNILGSYLSFHYVKRFFKKPYMNSIIASEAANNSGALSSLIPLLILSIPITGSETVIYYLLSSKGYEFTASSTINNFSIILYFIPFMAIFCMLTSWFGFNVISKIIYAGKKHIKLFLIAALLIISTISIVTYPIMIWMFICIIVLSLLGSTLKSFDTSPVIYGFFLSSLFYDNIIRLLLIV
jgi:putative tricarboxylic transport membrane protein